MIVDVARKDREKVIARQEFVDELSLWNDTEDVKSSVLLPSKFFGKSPRRCSQSPFNQLTVNNVGGPLLSSLFWNKRWFCRLWCSGENWQ